MKKSRLITLAILLMTTLMLSGCVWGGYGEHRGEDQHERDRGDYHGEDHGDHQGEDHGDHR